MPRKKTETEPKKKARRPKLGFLDHFIVLLEQFLAYFELLFIYFRKKFNESVRRTILLLVLFSYTAFLLFTSTGFFIHAGYLTLLKVFEGDLVYTSLSLGSGLFLLSLGILYFFIKKVVF